MKIKQVEVRIKNKLAKVGTLVEMIEEDGVLLGAGKAPPVPV